MRINDKRTFEAPEMVRKDPYACEYWGLLLPEIESLNPLGADLADLAAVCMEWSTYCTACGQISREGLVAPGSTKNTVASPWLKIRDAALTNIEQLLQRLGLDGCSRHQLRRQKSR